MKEPQPDTNYVKARILRINVGFLLAEGAGYSRVTTLDVPQRVRLADDITLEYLLGEIRLTRTSEGILVQGSLESVLPDECSRCLTEVEVPLTLTLEELFTTPPHQGSQFMVGDDNFIDLAPLVREEAFIAAPRKVYCRPDCQGLCHNCGTNLNEGTCECANQRIDPRWGTLAQYAPAAQDGLEG